MDGSMQLRKYQARTMPEALARVKRDLGRDAVILHTRTLRRGGVLGIGVKTWVEITATADERVGAIRRSVNEGRSLTESSLGTYRPGPAQTPDEETAAPQNSSSEPTPDQIDPKILNEIREIREMVVALAANTRKRLPRVPAELVQFYSRLIQQQVADDLALSIVERVSQSLASRPVEGDGESPRKWSQEDIQSALLGCIAEMAPACKPVELAETGPTIVALVGPTGVGKTTTLAKLAANMKLREGKKVGLITIDTYRIAAIEQLKTYAEIMQVPLVTVSQVEEIRPALDSMADLDLVLIDTAGRSQRDELKITELAEFLRASAPNQIHLVLSSTSQPKPTASSSFVKITCFAPIEANFSMAC